MWVQAKEAVQGSRRGPALLWVGLAMIAGVSGCGRSAPQAEDREAVPVEVAVMVPASVSETTVLTGILEGYRAVDVVSEVSGEVIAIRKDLGDRVDSGEILASVDKKVARESLNQAEAAVMAAEAGYELSRVDFQRDSTLFFDGTSSEAAYQRGRMAMTAARAELRSARAGAELAERWLVETDIRSPFAGIVSRRDCERGSFVSPGLPVYRVVDIDSLRLRLGVSQSEVARVHPGMKTRITVEALGHRVFEGRVRAVSPEADERTRTFTVEVVLANPAGHPLKDGMVVRVKLVLNTFDGAIRVPREAVLRNGDGGYVFVVADSIARRRNLELGALIDNGYLITGGLSPGDRVVTVGMQNLRDGFPVSLDQTSPADPMEEDAP